ncbi:hypothetical protein C8J56DRAFT_1045445 [Mycena floridula]|nr:hypothetical protein C8J56DRAFT_1045445 [Mycena floridula]
MAPLAKACKTHLPRLGVLNVSPFRKRNAKKTGTLVTTASQAARRHEIHSRLSEIVANIRSPEPIDVDTSDEEEEDEDEDDLAMVDDPNDADYGTPMPDVSSVPLVDAAALSPPSPNSQPETRPETASVSASTKTRSTGPTAKAVKVFGEWERLIPALVDPYLEYQARFTGYPTPSPAPLSSRCTRGCLRSQCRIKCHFLDCVYAIEVLHCQCEDVFTVLLRNGLFPASPTKRCTAFAISLLDLYDSLFERSCDAVNAMSSALQSYYDHRGFRYLHNNGSLIKDGIRKPLSNTIQWYDCLKVKVSEWVEQAIRLCSETLDDFTTPAPAPGPSAIPSEPPVDLPTPGEAARVLQDRCLACFGGRLWGRSFREGGDFHAIPPPFYDPKFFLPASYVQETKALIDAARSKPKKNKPKKLLDDAVDACEESHEAAKSDRKKGRQQFDDHGIMSLICRHDVPLFFVNIDTPGEGQQYPVSLIRHLFTLLPPQAQGYCLYDLGCVMDRSCDLYDIFPPDVRDRLQFATTAMHAYAHQWSCQLVFNPWLRLGLGLTDGEGVERIWAAIRALIGIARHSSRSRRIWLLDRLLQSTAAHHRDGLGDWLRGKLIKLKALENQHQAVLRRCPDSEDELRRQWASQKAEQTSIRAHLPARLKKELEQVLALQTEIHTVADSIKSVRATLVKTPGSAVALANLSALESVHATLQVKADDLYASLNVAESYPELEGVEIAFVQVLLLARDLKISLRKRAIGSFMEIDRLDQAVGGGQEALGTKLHQKTRKSMKTRSPALLSAVNKFNDYVDTLQSIRLPGQRTPIPHQLPTTLQDLCESPHLHEDIWISKTPNAPIPRWLEDLELRKAIRSRLYLDRSLEERRRLGREADNMCRWYGRKYAALELALSCGQSRAKSLVRELLHTRRRPPSLFTPVVPSLPISPIIDDDSDLDEDEDDQEVDRAYPIAEIMEALEIDSDDEEEAEGKDAVPGEPVTQVIVQPRLFRSTQMPFQRQILEDTELRQLALQDMHSVFLRFSQSFFDSPERPGSERRFLGNRSKGLLANTISSQSLQRLRDPSGWLNEECVMVGASVMFEHCLSTVPTWFALLSSYLPVQSSLEHVWRLTKNTSYWERTVWLLPYHRAVLKHWVLYVVYLNTGNIHLFDSFGEHRQSNNETAMVVDLVQGLIDLANKNGHDLNVPVNEWIVTPIVNSSSKLQTNGYDCGVWVLAMIFAVLRGAERMGGLQERDMKEIRRSVLKAICSLPAYPSS